MWICEAYPTHRGPSCLLHSPLPPHTAQNRLIGPPNLCTLLVTAGSPGRRWVCLPNFPSHLLLGGARVLPWGNLTCPGLSITVPHHADRRGGHRAQAWSIRDLFPWPSPLNKPRESFCCPLGLSPASAFPPWLTSPGLPAAETEIPGSALSHT